MNAKTATLFTAALGQAFAYWLRAVFSALAGGYLLVFAALLATGPWFVAYRVRCILDPRRHQERQSPFVYTMQ